MMKALFFFVLFLQVSSENDHSKFSSFMLSTQRRISSPQKVFELGFFKPSTSSGGAERWYLGIWHRLFPEEVFWVANRESPLSKPIGTLKVMSTELVLLDQSGTRVWWTNGTKTNPMKRRLAGELLDSGNLVLRYTNNDSSSVGFLWQSFDFPTDTLVSGMKLGWDANSNLNRVLRSWRDRDDPSPGEFTYGVEHLGLPQTYIRRDGLPMFRSDPWMTINDMGPASENLTNTRYNFTVTKEEATFVFATTNQKFYSLLRMEYSGLLNRSTWSTQPQHAWKLRERMAPRDGCDPYDQCGEYGVCDTSESPLICQCLVGFKPRDQQDRGGGCERKTELNCSGDGFARLKKLKLPDVSSSFVDRNISLAECKAKCLGDCSCTAYANTDARNGGSGCVIWDGGLLDLRKSNLAGPDLYVRLEATDAATAAEGAKKTSETIKLQHLVAIGVGIVAILLLGSVFVFFYFWRRKKTATGEIAAPQPAPIEVIHCAPMSLVNVRAATDNFSDSNKVGQGGFGIVYKGVLLDGQVVAAKRLSKKTAQGIEGFTNEVKLIASVQHVNLVQILGYCFDGEEMILLFEYLENSGLDTYIFDQSQSAKLNWEKRFLIINGIARGLLYLHQDSRFRIIHRDLKPSNILLDKDMVPKISDFGMAKLFKRDETEANTTKATGTYGYMSPEYAAHGTYSTKSDAFSFGVLVLEIISGKRNTDFFYRNEESLLSFIWRNWKEGNGLEAVDPVIIADPLMTFQPDEALRCIQIGLLCVQECAEDRPAMSSVVSMLTTQTTQMDHQPQPPGFYVGTPRLQTGSSSTKETWTVPDVTNSLVEGR